MLIKFFVTICTGRFSYERKISNAALTQLFKKALGRKEKVMQNEKKIFLAALNVQPRK